MLASGHSGFMEMNYTSEKDGKMDITKAAKVAEQFEVAKQFWCFIKSKKVFWDDQIVSSTLYRTLLSFGAITWISSKNVTLLVNANVLWHWKFSEDPAEVKQWAPLVMNGNDAAQKVAATRMDGSSDVNYGSITLIGRSP